MRDRGFIDDLGDVVGEKDVSDLIEDGDSLIVAVFHRLTRPVT
ncbi:hypothetical protein [Microbacterium schleiferi]